MAAPVSRLVLVMLVVGCDGGGGTQHHGEDAGADDAHVGAIPCVGARPDAVTVETHALAPSDTDPALSSSERPHHWAEPTGTAVGKLFVFFPGTGAAPEDYRHLLRNAAAGGYHALGLTYVNDQALIELCPGSDDPDCHEHVRREVIFGEDTTELVEVGPADSIQNRLVRALEHLGWHGFLEAGQPRWSDIAVAGHSQGGGHAAMIASTYPVHRAVLFAATEPAAWTLRPTATLPDRLWAFAHTEDRLTTGVQRSWQNLGIPGEPTLVDGSAPPFGGSHRLLSSLPFVDGQSAHNAPVVDFATPFDGDQPRYRDVWCHVIGP